MTNTFNCPTCGAPLDINAGSDPVFRCPYCKGTVVVPVELRSPAQGESSRMEAQEIRGTSSLKRQAERLAEVTRMAQSGQKIEAIKLFRQITGLSLKVAKDTVEAIQAGHPVTLSDFMTTPPVLDKSAMLYEVRRLVDEGNLTEAIKVYRESFDVSLKEAQTAIEKIRAGQFDEVQRMALQTSYLRQVQPPVRVSKPVAVAATSLGMGAGCFIVGLILFILLLTTVPILFALSQRGGPLFSTWSRLNPFGYTRLVQSFGDKGTGASFFQDARSVAIDPQNGDIIVAEYSTGRLQVFDPNGKFITQWEMENEDSPILDLDIDRRGNVYVVYNGEIHVLDVKTGYEITTLTSYGDQAGQFSNLALTEEGSMIAVSSGETLVRFNLDRTAEVLIPEAVSSISGDAELDSKIAIDGLGNIYILGIFNNSVFIFNPQGKLLSRFGSSGDAQGQFRAPYVIAVDNQSRVYISDSKGVQVFDSNGRYLNKFEANGFIFGIDINDQNEIFTISNNQKVSKFILRAP